MQKKPKYTTRVPAVTKPKARTDQDGNVPALGFSMHEAAGSKHFRHLNADTQDEYAPPYFAPASPCRLQSLQKCCSKGGLIGNEFKHSKLEPG
ncbi:hypothetical protein CJP46_30975 [Paenibacillus sp. XY044]|nr:hypothetical protein CJP46_30975 [Paenibacillus sp. XY044]